MELIRQFSTVAAYRTRIQQRKRELRRQIDDLVIEEAMLDSVLELIAEHEGKPTEKRGSSERKARLTKDPVSKPRRLSNKSQED